MEKDPQANANGAPEQSQDLTCATHPNKLIEKVCLEENCETSLLCSECSASHPFSHVSKTVALDFLTDDSKFLAKINKKLEKLKQQRKQELQAKFDRVKKEMTEQLEASFKSLEGRFETVFDQKVDSLLLRDYRDFLESFELNRSRYHLNLLRDKYRKLAQPVRPEGELTRPSRDPRAQTGQRVC